jgi:hypothetical protein
VEDDENPRDEFILMTFDEERCRSNRPSPKIERKIERSTGEAA